MRLRADGDRLVVNAPKGALSPELANGIRTHKAEILAYLGELGGGKLDEPPIAPGGDAATGTLSLSQTRLWILDQMTPGSAENNLSGVWRLEGPLDVKAMAAAARDFVRRHSLLRSGFDVVDGRPRLRTGAEPGVELRFVDLSDQPPEALYRWIADWQKVPFDLARGPIFNIHLVKLAEREHAICMLSHSLVWDGWSFDVFLDDMGALYRAHLDGVAPSLAPLELRFDDFAAWQRKRLDTPRARDHLAYWQRQLAGRLDPLPLPTDWPAAGRVTSRGGRENFVVGAEVTRDLYALSREEGVTPYTVLVAAYAALVGRLAHRDDIIVTTPVRGRDRLELEGLVGSFTNTLFLRFDLSGSPTFRELVRRARDVVLDGFARQDTPVDALLDVLEQDLAHTSLFQIGFSYQNTQARTTRWGPLGLKQVPRDTFAAHADLNLWVRDAGSSVSGAVDFRTDLFARSSILRIIDYLLELLAAGARAPDRRVDEIALPSVEVSGPPLSLPARSVPATVAHVAARTPDACAVASPDGRMSFAELAGAVAAASERLRAAGVRAGHRVGALLADARRTVVGLLAALSVGASWVPLDPFEAPERLRRQLRALDVRSVFADVDSDADVPSLEVPLGGAGAFLDESVVAAPALILSDGISFSGAALAAAVASRIEQHGLGSKDRVFVELGTADPAATPALLAPLCAGAELCLARPSDGGPALAAFVAAARPTLVEADPAVLAALPRPGGGRVVVHAAELTAALAGELLAAGYEVRSRSGGPASLGMGAANEIRSAADVDRLGAPVPGATLRLVDQRGRAAPIGVDGELVVDGPFVGTPARGSELTARWLDGRTLERRSPGGRSVSGRRLDLALIEKTLAALPAVRACHVALRGEAAQGRVLVAWVVPAAGVAVSQTSLRAALAPELPASHLPRVIVVVDEIPRAAGGAVLERELRDPFGEVASARFEPPADGFERVLAGIWSEALGVDRIGAHDNFFELGGSSLLALKVIAEIEKRTGTKINPRLLFFQSLRRIAAPAPAPGAA